MQSLGCANQKASKLLKELDSIGLIERRRRGLGKPDLIYVKSFIVTADSQFSECENHLSVETEITSGESLKSLTTNTDMNNTDSLRSAKQICRKRIEMKRMQKPRTMQKLKTQIRAAAGNS